MHHPKKSFLLCAVTLCAAVALAGCSAASSSASSSTPVSGGKDGQKSLVGRITALTENSITLETMGDAANFESRLESGLEAPEGEGGQLPDQEGQRPNDKIPSEDRPEGKPNEMPGGEGKSGEAVTLSLDDATLYLENGENIKWGDLAVGDFVTVQQQDGRAVQIEKARQIQGETLNPAQKGENSSQPADGANSSSAVKVTL